MPNITFNEKYSLKPDKGKALILATYLGRTDIEGYEDSSTNIIHPLYAMMLSRIDGRNKTQCIKDIADEFEVPESLVTNLVDRLLDNPEIVAIKNKDGISLFPPLTIVSCPEPTGEAEPKPRYEPEMFAFREVDLNMGRHITPSTITLMLNNVCVTDCVYCYQDKRERHLCDIPLERILELIEEARSMHVTTFDVIGGEFFLYPHWREVLGALRKAGYNPYLSTKMPLTEEMVGQLAELDIHDIQISLDTLIENHLVQSLRVAPGYAGKMKETLRLLAEAGIPVMVHTVLTRHNATAEDMESVYSFIKDLPNIALWHIVKGDPSLYPKTPYEEIEIDDESIRKINAFLEPIRKEAGFRMKLPEVMDAQPAATADAGEPEGKDTEKGKPHGARAEEQVDDEAQFRMEMNRFLDRSFCSGLFSSLYVLPDGNVTFCEQLYWNKDFIVGNILHETLEEIWNSEKATSLFFIRQDQIPEDSACHACPYFNICRNLRQICYREIIRVYGADKWYWPAPECPYARRKMKEQPQ